MKVLHFYQSSLPDSVGGIETVIDEIASNSLNYGIKPVVLSLSDNINIDYKFYNGYEIYQAKRIIKIASTGISLSVFKLFNELSKTADIVHYHFPWPWMDLVHFVTNIKKPSVVTYHSDIIRQKKLLSFYKPLQHKFLHSVDSIVATSPNYLNSSDILSYFKNKVSIIPIGVSDNKFPLVSALTLSKWANKFSKPFFLFVGVLRYYKGLHILLDAIENSEFVVVIAGSGPIENELKSKAKKLKLKNIHFLGKLDEEDKVALYTLSFAVIFPSHIRSEAFGITLLEGAIFSKPLISCEIQSGTSYINIDGETGIVVKPNCKNSLSTAMQYLISNPQRANIMGTNARKRFENYFTSSKMTQDYINIYRKILRKY